MEHFHHNFISALEIYSYNTFGQSIWRHYISNHQIQLNYSYNIAFIEDFKLELYTLMVSVSLSLKQYWEVLREIQLPAFQCSFLIDTHLGSICLTFMPFCTTFPSANAIGQASTLKHGNVIP